MSETQSETSLDFQPLIDSDTEDFEMTPIIADFPSPHVPRRRRRLWLVPLVIVLLIILIGGGVFAYTQFNRPPAVQYTQAAAAIGNLAVTVSATGPVQANAVYNLNFPASGTVKAINVQVGQQVKAGQVLAKLDSTSFNDAINQAQQSVNSAQTGVNTAETNLSNTKSQQAAALNTAYLQEQNALTACTSTTSTTSTSTSTSKTGTTGTPTPTPTPAPTPTPNPTVVANCEQLAQDQYAQAQAQATSSISSASNQVTSAQQQVNNAQAQLQTAQDNLASATLTAPHAGTIVEINGIVGQTTGSGGSGSSSSSSAFIILVDSSSLNIAAQVNEADIANVQVDQPAQFTVAAYPSQTFRASVTGINTQGQTTSNVVTYAVNLGVDMQSLKNAHIYPGMTATVNITTAERIGTLLVPAAALSFSATAIQNGELSRTALRSLVSNTSSSATATGGSTSGRGIVVELKNGKLVPVLVTTGLSNGQYTEILSGLKSGDEVVVSQTGGTTTTTGGTSSGRGGFGGGGFGGGGFGGGGGRTGGGTGSGG